MNNIGVSSSNFPKLKPSIDDHIEIDQQSSETLGKRKVSKVKWTPSTTDASLINLIPKIESKPRIDWNLGMWRHHNQQWIVWLISQEFECHGNLISSKSL